MPRLLCSGPRFVVSRTAATVPCRCCHCSASRGACVRPTGMLAYVSVCCVQLQRMQAGGTPAGGTPAGGTPTGETSGSGTHPHASVTAGTAAGTRSTSAVVPTANGEVKVDSKLQPPAVPATVRGFIFFPLPSVAARPACVALSYPACHCLAALSTELCYRPHACISFLIATPAELRMCATIHLVCMSSLRAQR